MKAIKIITALVVISAVVLAGQGMVFAHCDTMDGPVIKAAQKAIEANDVNLVLIWVQKQDEAEIKKAFQKTLVVRKLSPEAKELSDMYFFETLVRIHRAGEGAPYTGLKPAGTELSPAVSAADKAIESGSVEDLEKLLNQTIHKGLDERFGEVLAKKNFNKDNIDAGREYVKSYITFVHYAEPIYEAAKGAAAEEQHKPQETQTHQGKHHH